MWVFDPVWNHMIKAFMKGDSMPEFSINDVRKLELINGIKAHLWVISEKQIGKFIEANKLKAVDRRIMGVSKDMPAERMIDIDYLIGIRGGRRVAHLHYKGDLYLLSSAQWREFSGKVVKDMSKRLAEAKQVNLTELLEVTEAVGAVVR